MCSFISMAAAALALFSGVAAMAQSTYNNPVDGKSYMAPGGFKTYEPASPRDTRGQRVTTQGITLLTSEQELKARVKLEELTSFVKSVEQVAYAELQRNKAAMATLVQFNCQPGKCAIKLASQGQAEEAVLQRLHDALSKLAPLKTSGEAIFQVEFRVAA